MSDLEVTEVGQRLWLLLNISHAYSADVFMLFGVIFGSGWQIPQQMFA